MLSTTQKGYRPAARKASARTALPSPETSRRRALKYASVNGEVVPAVSEHGDFRLYHWAAINCPRPPQDENLPSREELRPVVACSTSSSVAKSRPSPSSPVARARAKWSR